MSEEFKRQHMPLVGPRRSSRKQKASRREAKPGGKLRVSIRMEADDRVSKGDYQRKIRELELKVTTLRERQGAMREELNQLRSSHLAWLSLFEDCPAGFIVHDRFGGISKMNRAAGHLLGLAKRDRGRVTNLAQVISEQDFSAWLQHLEHSASRKRGSCQLRFRTGTGQSIPVHLITEAIAEPVEREPVTFQTIFFDITQHKAAEAALEATQRSYHELIDTVEGIVWDANAETLDCTFVSGFAERLLGYPVSEWLRTEFWQNHIHPGDRDRVLNEVTRAVARRERLATEYRVLTRQGRVVWLHDNITPVIRHGEVRLLGVAVDVTQRREAEDQLQRAHDFLEQRVAERTSELRQSIADLEAFSYSASHDLRSPLRAMRGFAELAMQHGAEELSPRLRDYLKRILGGAKRADLLVQDLLNYSRISCGNITLEPIALEELITNVVEQNTQFQPPNAELELRRPLLPVIGHKASLAQCITNLLSNATKFVPPGSLPRVQIWTQPMGNQVRLWVEDNGIGIEQKDLARIFGIFERIQPIEQYEGTGIGLAIVRKAAERMGGSVGVESQPQHGSRFWIQLKGATPGEQVDTPG